MGAIPVLEGFEKIKTGAWSAATILLEKQQQTNKKESKKQTNKNKLNTQKQWPKQNKKKVKSKQQTKTKTKQKQNKTKSCVFIPVEKVFQYKLFE